MYRVTETRLFYRYETEPETYGSETAEIYFGDEVGAGTYRNMMMNRIVRLKYPEYYMVKDINIEEAQI